MPPAGPVADGAAPDEIEIAVCGAHMSGLPLNGELTGLGGRFLRAVRTAPVYRLYALAGGPPRRPGMVRGAGGGAIAVEVWALPKAAFGDFIAAGAGAALDRDGGACRTERGRRDFSANRPG